MCNQQKVINVIHEQQIALSLIVRYKSDEGIQLPFFHRHLVK